MLCKRATSIASPTSCDAKAWTSAMRSRLPAMRAEAAAAVPGTQTVYLPGEDYPERTSQEALDAALTKIREKRRESFEASTRESEPDGA